MTRYQKQIGVLIGSVLIYFALSFCYQKYIISPKFTEVYVLTKEVERGEALSSSHVQKVQIKELKDASLYIQSEQEMLEKCAMQTLPKGTLLQFSFLMEKEEKIEEGKERISLHIADSEDMASFQIEKGSVINVYVTGKANQMKPILHLLGENQLAGEQQDSYITVQILQEISVIQVYDAMGNIVSDNRIPENSKAPMDTFMIEVDTSMALKINQLKQYGKFSISIVR